MKKSIKEANFDTSTKEFQNISPNAVDLIQQMLKAKPSERITIEDVMQHPWINQDINEIPENKIIMDENAMDYFTKKGKVNDAMTEALKHERLPEDQAFKVVEVNSLKSRMRNRKNRNQNKESNKRNLNETTRWFF